MLLAASCGSDSDTSPPAIPSSSDAIAVAAGSSHTCALQQTGEIACWGNNEHGQLGNGTNDDSEVPVPVTGIDDATAIAAGGELANSGHSCALHRTGSISCWGNNTAGQLGNGQSNDGESSSAPVQVAGVDDATAIAAGEAHTCALQEGGTVSCWGSNAWGELGNGQIIQNSENSTSDTPVQVVGIDDATAITAGFDHSCALHEDGTVSCWGRNDWGQLAADRADTLNISSVPVQIEGIDDATAIAAGVAFSCALHEDGDVSCWGRNNSNQLGSDITDRYSAPVAVPDITDATAITAGSEHSCVLREDGTISCWGSNDWGQLGNGTTNQTTLPVRVSLIADAAAITAGSAHSCALLQAGTISCWGNNNDGQLGDGTNNNYAVPVEVIGFPPARAEETAATALPRTTTTAIAETAAAPTTDLPTTTALTAEAAPTTAPPTTTPPTTTTTSAPTTTTTTTTTTAPPPTTAAPTTSPPPTTAPPAAAAQTAPPPSTAPPPTQPPTTAPPPPTTLPANRAAAISAGREHSCALHRTGTISCWGSNTYRQLGDGTRQDSSVPVQVTGTTDATAITAGRLHSCALHQNGTMSCWGNNQLGQLGNGTARTSSVPVQVTGITDATAITAGGSYSCALRQNGTISCWGYNRQGQLGDGTRSNSVIPVQVAGITDATAITAGTDHSCALHQDGTISCWGSNDDGQLGNGESRYGTISSVPVRVVGITDATAITAGNAYSCALHQNGTISCWGANSFGRLGNGQSGRNAKSAVPVQVSGITDATAITAGSGHSCALHQDGSVSCWGFNLFGGLGNGQSGRNADSPLPVQVSGITDATAITAGSGHSCALHQDGSVSCWGSNDDGQLGNGTNRRSLAPVQVVGFGG